MLRTEDVRDAYVYNSEGNQWPGADVRREREFDLWLAEVQQEAFLRGENAAHNKIVMWED